MPAVRHIHAAAIAACWSDTPSGRTHLAADRVENRGLCRTLAMPVVSRYPGTLPAEDGT